MLDPLQYYCRVLCNGMKTRFRMVMIAHPGPGIGFHKRFMWRMIILPTLGELKVFLENNWRMHWGRTSLQKSIFVRVTLSRYCLKPNSSVGALNGASYQLLGADMESLNRMGLYLESKMVSECSHRRCLIQHTHYFENEGNNLLVTCLLLHI